MTTRYIFLCSSQYATLNAINIVQANELAFDSEYDIAIFRRTCDLEGLACRLQVSGLFKNVYLLPFVDKVPLWLRVLFLIYPLSIFNGFLKKNKSKNTLNKTYDVIFAQSILYATLFKRFNKDAKVFLLEDGLSSYTSRASSKNKRSRFFNIVDSLFFKGDFLDSIKGQYLNQPDLYKGDMPTRKINISTCSELERVIKKIFEYKECEIYTKFKYIYLGVPLFGLRDLQVVPTNSDDSFESYCMMIIDSAIGFDKKKQFIYRKHPIENMDAIHYESLCEIDQCNNLWELECSNNITPEHVIVSFFSTAAFTPKMLYGKEPYVIFLYKLLGVEFFNADHLVEGLRELYSDSSRVMVVLSLSELDLVLKSLRG